MASVTGEQRLTVPPLQAGDHLTRDEFERRYAAMPAEVKAELIDGVVYMPSPVKHTQHGKPHFGLVGWLALYAAGTPGVDGGDNSTLRLDLDNEPQPDAYLRILHECGGQCRVDEEGYLAGAPELLAEVSASSASYDLHAKKKVYRRHGAHEYIVWRVLDEQLDWFVLRAGKFERLDPGDDGIHRSAAMPGLWLDAAALIAGDLARVLAVVQQGLATPEHAAFVKRLAKNRG